jgi:hypothetical protein
MLDNGDYELVLGQDQGFSEDPINVAEDLTEAPNQSSEVSDIPAPNPTQEAKPLIKFVENCRKIQKLPN